MLRVCRDPRARLVFGATWAGVDHQLRSREERVVAAGVSGRRGEAPLRDRHGNVRVAAAVAAVKADGAQPRPREEPDGVRETDIEAQRHLDGGEAVAGFVPAVGARPAPVERLVGSAVVRRPEADEGVLGDGHLVLDREGQPGGTPGPYLIGEPIGGMEEPIHIAVEADAGAQAEVEERRRKNARLLRGAEGEEPQDRDRPVVLVGGGDDEAEGRTQQALAEEVERGQEPARDPDGHVAHGGGALSAAVVVGQHPPRAR